MSDLIKVKTKTCHVCGEYEVMELDKDAVTRWQSWQNIQDAFPDMSVGDRELLISGTHPACWDKLFPEEGKDYCDDCGQVEWLCICEGGTE